MRRTPLEIKKQSFTKSLRGYEPDEVRSFLSTLSDEWEEMIRENRQLKKEISGLSETLKHYKKVEEALQETLQTAKTSAGKKVASAGREAEIIRAAAKQEASEITRKANGQRERVQQQIVKLADKRDELIQIIRTYLQQSMASLDEFNEEGQELIPKVAGPAEITVPGAENMDEIIDQID
ncbi:MAG TPA: DivIVA domain-containing protein [Balneolaceae bacterium]|nr:DivIVA domain-containing protein [Balneolaceae bacterium]